MNPKEKSLREIIRFIRKHSRSIDFKSVENQALSAIESHYSARRLSEKNIWDIVCSYFKNKMIKDNQFMKKVTYPDLKTLANAIFKAQEKKDR